MVIENKNNFLKARLLYRRKKYRLAQKHLIDVFAGGLTDLELIQVYSMLTHIYQVWIKQGAVQFKSIAVETCFRFIEWYDTALPSLRALGESRYKTEVFFRLSELLMGEGLVEMAIEILEKAIDLGIDFNGKHSRRAAYLRSRYSVKK